jgi:hypothetical protein
LGNVRATWLATASVAVSWCVEYVYDVYYLYAMR